MKWIIAAIMVISILLVAGCTVQQPTNQPTEKITPLTLEVETSNAPASETASYQQVYQVAIENGNLMPVDVEINAGDTVEWVNKDAVRYTLRFSNSAERLPVGGTFEQTFTELGIVRYTAAMADEDQEDVDEDQEDEEEQDLDEERELSGTVIVT